MAQHTTGPNAYDGSESKSLRAFQKKLQSGELYFDGRTFKKRPKPFSPPPKPHVIFLSLIFWGAVFALGYYLNGGCNCRKSYGAILVKKQENPYDGIMSDHTSAFKRKHLPKNLPRTFPRQPLRRMVRH